MILKNQQGLDSSINLCANFDSDGIFFAKRSKRNIVAVYPIGWSSEDCIAM